MLELAAFCSLIDIIGPFSIFQ